MTKHSKTITRRIRKKQNRIRDRIRPIVEDLSARWLDFCAKRTSRRVVAITPRDRFSFSSESIYHVLHEYVPGVEFYNVRLALHEPHREGPLAPGCEIEERFRKAVLTYNTCMDACVAFWEHLHKVFGAMDDFVGLEVRWQHVRPRFVLFPSTEVPDQETLFWHHYIVVTFRRGISFVLDFSGYQFGFSKVFYTLKQYEDEVLDGTEYPEVEDVPALIEGEMEKAMSEQPSAKRRRAGELFDLIFSL